MTERQIEQLLAENAQLKLEVLDLIEENKRLLKLYRNL